MDTNLRSRLAGNQPSPSQRKRGFLDPVCEMNVDAWEPQYEVIREGIAYHFCSSECKQTFQLFPGKFLKNMRNPKVHSSS